MNMNLRLPPCLFCSRIAWGLLWIVVASFGGAWANADEIMNSVGMKLRLLDAGRFEMGERDLDFYKDHSEFSVEDSSPVHPVVLTKSFYLATTEVTVKQFRKFVEQTGYKTSAEKSERGAVGWDPQPPADNPRYVSTFREGREFNWKHPGYAQTDDHPVVAVSFADAQAYCQWLSNEEQLAYRLPTEAEWEYAARAGTRSAFSFGDAYRGEIQRFANIGNVELEKAFPDRVRRQWLVDIESDPADQHIFTAPVGSYAANPWGLHDMYGNVWEWCEDRYLDTAYAPYTRPGHEQIRQRAIDPLVMEKGSDGDWRVIRGGSWFNAPIQCRSSVRGYFEADDAACYLGFRIARDASEEVVSSSRKEFETSEAARATISRLAERMRERRDGRLTVELNHDRQPLTDEFVAALQQLDEPVDLYLHGHLSGSQIAALAKIRFLSGFVVSNLGPEIRDNDFAPLADHLELELLQITGAPQFTNGLLQHFRNLQRLELLRLESSAITDEGLAALPPLKSLKTLDLRGTSSEGSVLRHFRNSPLEQFSCDQLSDENAQLLAGFPTLREIDVSGSSISAPGLAAIAQLPRLQRLNLTGCHELKDADFAVLGEAYVLSSLQMAETSAGDRAAAGLTRLNNLRELRIGGDQLTDAGIKKLCEIVSLRNFTIAAEAVNVTDAAFVDLWRLVNLESFGVTAPQVTGTGFTSLSELPELAWLSLQGQGLRDAALMQASKSTSLKQLSVGSWEDETPGEVTDEGVLQLIQARGLVQFELIRRHTEVTDAGIEKLRRERPQIKLSIH